MKIKAGVKSSVVTMDLKSTNSSGLINIPQGCRYDFKLPGKYNK